MSNQHGLAHDHPNYEYRLMKKARYIVTNATPEDVKRDLEVIREVYGEVEAKDLRTCCAMWWRSIHGKRNWR